MSAPKAGGVSEPPPAAGREPEEELDLARLAYTVAALAAGAAVMAWLYWRFRRIEGIIARRHPLLTEVLEELADPGWRR